MSKVSVKEVAPKVLEIPILMQVAPTKPRVKKQRPRINPLNVLFHTNSVAAVGIAFINAFNGGPVVVTMLLMTMAFITEMFLMVVKDYSEADREMAKYKTLVKTILERIKKKNVA